MLYLLANSVEGIGPFLSLMNALAFVLFFLVYLLFATFSLDYMISNGVILPPRVLRPTW